jgi:hypothetical protein
MSLCETYRQLAEEFQGEISVNCMLDPYITNVTEADTENSNSSSEDEHNTECLSIYIVLKMCYSLALILWYCYVHALISSTKSVTLQHISFCVCVGNSYHPNNIWWREQIMKQVLMSYIFHAIALHMFLLPTTAQQFFLLLHVSATCCSHHQGVIFTDMRSI